MGISIQLNFDTLAERDEVLAYFQKTYDITKTVTTQTNWSMKAKPVPVPTPTPTPTPTPAPLPAGTLFLDAFEGIDGVITNEYAWWNKTSPLSKQSPNWDMDSGSLFRKSGRAWTGIPDGVSPNWDSSIGNNSCIFRLVTKRQDFQTVKVGFDFKANKFVVGSATPAVDWDGAHIFLRYQSEYHLYYASFLRRDGSIVIKKKLPGGPSNNGTYYEISSYVPSPVPVASLNRAEATIKTLPDNTVEIALYLNGTLALKAIDANEGGPAILNPGRVGIRGDNLDFTFDNFQVTG